MKRLSDNGSIHAIGALAALAGLAALRASSGSRSTQSGVRFERVSDEQIYQAMREGNEALVAVEVFTAEPGIAPKLIQRISLIELFDETAVEAYVGMGDDFDPELASAWVLGFDSAIKYFSELSFPMRVYRGLRYTGGGEPRLVSPGVSWTPDRAVAESFADGSHFSSSDGDTGRVLTAVLPTPEDVDWAQTLALYVAFTAFMMESEVERQIRPLDDRKSLRRVRELR
jgi:hypothetical protein